MKVADGFRLQEAAMAFALLVVLDPLRRPLAERPLKRHHKSRLQGSTMAMY
jgi:hypothetical protein